MNTIIANTNTPIGYELTHLHLRPSTLSHLLKQGYTSTLHLPPPSSSNSTSSSSTSSASQIGDPSLLGYTSLANANSARAEVTTAISYHVKNLTPPLSSVSTTANTTATTATATALVPGKTASALYKESKSKKHKPIITFCRAIDNLLGGGISLNEVTEIAGGPGTGKTQLCMQLCVDARLPSTSGGCNGESIYIDTEGSFAPERTYSIAKYLAQHLEDIQRRKQSGGNAPQPPELTVEEILSGIHVYRVYDSQSLLSTIASLPLFMKARAGEGHLPIKLIILDSIALPFRSNPNFNDRSRSLNKLMAGLSDLCVCFDLSVVVVNQMTTVVNKDDASGNASVNGNANEGKSSTSSSPKDSNNHSSTAVTHAFGSAGYSTKLTPALGESFAHASSTRIILSLTNFTTTSNVANDNSSINSNGSSNAINTIENNVREFLLLKSPNRPCGKVLFVVSDKGIRDVEVSGGNGGGSVSSGGGGRRGIRGSKGDRL